jgi:AcrR family transcriptional regulator
MARRPATKRQIQAVETRDRIYDIAIKLMDKKGFDGMTIAEIGKMAGISVGTFYHYFSTKYDILAEIFHRADDYFSTEVATELRSKKWPTSKKVVLYFDRYAEFNLATGVKTLQQLYSSKIKFFIKKGRPMQVALEEILANGQRTGEIRSDMSADEIVTYLFVFARGVVYEWCLFDGRYDIKKYMREYMGKLIGTITTKN